MERKSLPTMISDGKMSLQLYVSGMSPKSLEAIRNLKRICDEYMKDRFELEVIDIYKKPELASEQSIVFSPSLVKMLPLPKKVLIGTMQDAAKVVKALGLTFAQ